MRLSDIDPEQLALDTVSAAIERVHQMASTIDASAAASGILIMPAQPVCTVLGYAVYRLVLYARDGVAMGASVAQECGRLQDVAAADMDDPSIPLGIVMSAALAREAIDAGHAVSTSWLAALGSVGSSYVRNQVAEGVLRARYVTARRSEVTAADARRWLGARGVSGYRS